MTVADSMAPHDCISASVVRPAKENNYQTHASNEGIQGLWGERTKQVNHMALVCDHSDPDLLVSQARLSVLISPRKKNGTRKGGVIEGRRAAQQKSSVIETT